MLTTILYIGLSIKERSIIAVKRMKELREGINFSEPSLPLV